MKLSAPLRRLARAAAMLSLAALGWGAVPALAREGGTGLSASAEAIAPASPDAALAAALFQLPPDRQPGVARQEAPVPGWRVEAEGRPLGLIGSTWELANSTGYSGRPLDVLVAVAPDGRVTGARLMRHAEPVLTLGISDADIAAYVDGFRGYDTTRPGEDAEGLPDVISRATVSTGVIRDGVLRTARILGAAQGEGGVIDRVAYQPADWAALEAMGALSHARASMADAARAFAGARQVPTPSDEPFLEFWAGIIDTPTAGRSLLGQQPFNAVAGARASGEALLAVFSRGATGHRGTGWKRAGTFERIAVTQGEVTLTPAAEGYAQVNRIAAEGAPSFTERSVFRINADPERGGIDLTQPFTVTVTATRPAAGDGGTLALPLSAQVSVPEAFRLAPPVPEIPLWQQFWQAKKPQVAVVGAMLGLLGLILFGQEWLVRRAGLWRRVRLAYLFVTLVVLGWGLNAQLSIVQVVAFLHALLSGFHWETFLVAPLIFVLWSAVALGMLFWGRGVFCGWLCPFGALQELTNAAAQRLGLRQIAVPQALHERLWVIKYTLFVAIVALSFYSMERSLVLAEAEPFKTAISMYFLRPWPFVLYALALLGAGLFIERFFCRYVCPLGAGLAIPAKLKIFDWLKRRPQCGRECRLCETKCPVGAIDPLGRINPNECVMCLRCQTIMDDENTCPVLKRRARGAGGFKAPPVPTAPATGPVPPPIEPTQVPAGAHAGAAAPGSEQPPAFRSQQVTS